MRDWKRTGVFFLILILAAAGAALLFWNLWAESGSVLFRGEGRDTYLLSAKNAYGNTVCVLGRTDGEYRIVMGNEQGKREALWKLDGKDIPQKSRPASLYQAVGGAVYLGLYNMTAEETSLEVYRITDKGRDVSLLLSEPCKGAGLQEQMKNVRLSAFAEVNNAVTFAVLNGNTANFYQYTGTVKGGLNFLQTAQTEGLRNAVALSDGSFVLITQNAFLPVGGGAVTLPAGRTIEQVAQSGTALYYVEGSTLSVCYVDFLSRENYTASSLEKDAYDINECTSLQIGASGECLLLMDGRQLLVDYGSVLGDASGMLHRPALLCVLSFALGIFGVLTVALVLWFLLSEEHRFFLPLLLRWGIVTAAVALLSLGILLRFAVIPSYEAATEREAVGQIGSVTMQANRNGTLTSPSFPADLGAMLGGDRDSLFRDTAVTLFSRDAGGSWYVTASNDGLAPGSRAELCPAFNRARMVAAWQRGSDSWSYESGGHTRYVFCRTQGSSILCADADGAALLEATGDSHRWMLRQAAVFTAIFVLVEILSLTVITRNLRKVSSGMERLAEGTFDTPVRVNGTDELSSLADWLNALSFSMEQTGQEQAALAQSYHRFVPERVLSLLGRESIQEVDKQTFASRSLAAMMLSFQFPAEIYERSGRELFDNINEIIERTAPIVTRKGGTVFNFAYNGYDAVFKGGSAVAVSTAVEVQQEVLEINRERQEAGRPPVTMCIALDEGSVMIGVVGDESQLEVTSISSSFSVGRHLLELCQKLQASILCTETVIRGAKDYGSRYMGLCTEGGEDIRTYEIFDGDPYEVRKRKEVSGAQFSEGVYALYGRDYSRAKRIFLDLVHRNAGDGGARYYLYLADRLEKRTGEEISLDANVT